MTLSSKWKEHLGKNNMSYCDHWKFAVGYGYQCIKAGIYLCIHGFLPCFYRHAGSKLVHKLEKVFTEREHELNK
jgi:hypothetical protein